MVVNDLFRPVVMARMPVFPLARKQPGKMRVVAKRNTAYALWTKEGLSALLGQAFQFRELLRGKLSRLGRDEKSEI